MRRGDRLFDLIRVLRTQNGPITAGAPAERLEVTIRTVYRDIATLQVRRIPIEGAAGVGYVLRRGFDLPPLMFTVEAVVVGARMPDRTATPGCRWQQAWSRKSPLRCRNCLARLSRARRCSSHGAGATAAGGGFVSDPHGDPR
jgi:hypothetical protein